MATGSRNSYIRLFSWTLAAIACCIVIGLTISLMTALLTSTAMDNLSEAEMYLAQIDIYTRLSLIVGCAEFGILFGMTVLYLSERSDERERTV